MKRSDSVESLGVPGATVGGATKETGAGATQGGGGSVASPAPAPPAPVLANVPVQHESATGK